MKYVVLKPSVTYYAFGRCFPVSRITSSFIFYTKKRVAGGDTFEEKASKKNVLFFCDEDVSGEIYKVNLSCGDGHKKFQKKISSIQKNLKKKYGKKE